MQKKSYFYLLVVSISSIVFSGCAHTYYYKAIDQELEFTALRKSFLKLLPKENLFKDRKIALRFSGFGSFITHEMAKQILVDKLRRYNVDIVGRDKAELEFSLISKVFGVDGIQTTFPLIYNENERFAKVYLFLTVFDLKENKVIYTKDSSSSSSWSEGYILGIIGPIRNKSD
ncbi:MAG: hypothetical protein AB1349_14250 [Elusimicrobiota bacterium]